ncbi:MAG: Leg1-related protein [Anaerolineae bacterium]
MSQSTIERLTKADVSAMWSALPQLAESADPFVYEQRMAIYRLLIESMNGRGVFGAENEWNVFWGYFFQLEWQWRSGRLHLDSTPPGRIDPNSMWGYANYSLSVIPYIAAAQLGIAPEIELLPAYAESAVDYPHGGGSAGAYQIPPLFEEPLREWRRFFEYARQFEPGKDIEPMRRIQWDAHKSSLVTVERGVFELGRRFSSPSERDFLLGWIRMVDFLGTAAWRTDLLYMLENGIGTLPERALTPQDARKVAHMDDRANNNLKNIIGLTHQSKLRFGFNLYLWKRAMRTRQARDEVLPMLDATFNPSPKNVRERRRLLRYVLAL